MKRESGVNPERCSHVYGSGLANHWETGKGSAVMNEVRRPASVWNLKPAANRLVFLRTYDPLRVTARMYM